jgi:hypothetical protein
MQASLDHSAEELKRIRQGLAPEQASALERTIEEDRL